MRLAGSDDTQLAVEAERVLGEISTDRLALKTTRDGLQAKLRRLPVERSRASEITKLHCLLFNGRGSLTGRGWATTGRASSPRPILNC
jgi:hypothetical protein